MLNRIEVYLKWGDAVYVVGRDWASTGSMAHSSHGSLKKPGNIPRATVSGIHSVGPPLFGTMDFQMGVL